VFTCLPHSLPVLASCLAISRQNGTNHSGPIELFLTSYYVGTNYLASFLITTPEGHILINPDYEQSVPLIRANVERLGFRFPDIKIILISHAHDDDAAGCALAKKLTGAKLMVMDGDVEEIEGGGSGDFLYYQHWAPAKVDRILCDGDHVTVGGMTLIAHLTPGHTKGCTTWTTDIKEGKHVYHVVIVGSPNVNSGCRLIGNSKYPQVVTDYERPFRVLASLPCDVFLGAHGVYYGMDDKLKRLRAGGRNPFIDPEGYRAYIKEREQAFRVELSAQQKQGELFNRTRETAWERLPEITFNNSAL
jgi:metallo-beta-lactamase class B